MRDEALRRLRAANPVPTEPPVTPVDVLTAGWPEPEPLAISSPRGARRFRSTGLSVVLALVVGTGSAAAALAAFTGSPIPRSGDTVTVRPADGTTYLSSTRATDPDAGPPWALRLGAAGGGLQCLGVGQVQGDTLGLVGLDGRFRAVPPAGGDDCGVAPSRPDDATVLTRTFLGRTTNRSVTVIYGVVGKGLGSVRVTYVDGARTTVPVGSGGGFVIARRGRLTQQHPVVELGLRSSAQGHYVRLTRLGRPSTRVGPIHDVPAAKLGRLGAPTAPAAAASTPDPAPDPGTTDPRNSPADPDPALRDRKATR